MLALRAVCTHALSITAGRHQLQSSMRAQGHPACCSWTLHLISRLRLLQVLVEGPSKRDASSLTGRTDTMKRVVFPDMPMAAAYGGSNSGAGAPLLHAQPGDYVAVEVRKSGDLQCVHPSMQLLYD
jgi:TRAM domain